MSRYCVRVCSVVREDGLFHTFAGSPYDPRKDEFDPANLCPAHRRTRRESLVFLPRWRH
ncbi:MAG: hypothetical protein UY92_C0006G0091 [Candidatus Magasanikbacteria bacterium GW2011_GWA2_56_11]|uniref:Uncharacterized protein n=1 Tax=Candidatus Magasanikbacteria bacterium GW2011_GWA2_56_11 TaxID=1619044 RepID=A0A0G1YH33_9BACT|nr:MAG: hypothetical protein UY92_C0006G0091 [Candidatus Magasanikbacteria bacterium GW2011_GWA2_56_11]